MRTAEQKKDDLFYTCSLIEAIGRATKNKRSDVVRYLGPEAIAKIYRLADVYHCDVLEAVVDSFITECQIPSGSFDNVSCCKYAIPSVWDIGKVYQRLILGVAEHEGVDVLTALDEVYAHFVSDLISDFNSSFYYDSPACHLTTYIYNEVEA